MRFNRTVVSLMKLAAAFTAICTTLSASIVSSQVAQSNMAVYRAVDMGVDVNVGDTEINTNLDISKFGGNADKVILERFDGSDKLMINPVSDEDISVSVSADNTAVIALNNPVKEGEKFRICIPSLKKGENLFDYYIEATAGESHSCSNGREILFKSDFEDYNSSKGDNIPPSNFSKATIAGGNNFAVYRDKIDEEHGNSAVIELTADGAAYGGMEWNNAVSIDNDTDALEISFDFYLNEQTATANDKHRIWCGAKSGANWNFGINMFTNNNQWIYKDGKLNGEEIKIGDKNVPGWNSFKMVYLPNEKMTEYHMNGTVIGKFNANSNVSDFGKIIFGGGSDKTGAIAAYDNIEITKVKKPKSSAYISYIKFADSRGNIIPSQDGRIFSGVQYVRIGIEDCDNIEYADIRLEKDGNAQDFTADRTESSITLTLDDRLTTDSDYTLSIKNILAKDYIANFKTSSDECYVPDLIDDEITTAQTIRIPADLNTFELELNTALPYLSMESPNISVYKFSIDDKMMLNGTEFYDFELCDFSPTKINFEINAMPSEGEQYRISFDTYDIFGQKTNLVYDIVLSDTAGVMANEKKILLFEDSFDDYSENTFADTYSEITIAGSSGFSAELNDIDEMHGKSAAVFVQNGGAYGAITRELNMNANANDKRIEIEYEFYFNQKTENAKDKHRMWSGIMNDGVWILGANIFADDNQWVYNNGSLSGNGTATVSRKAPGWNTFKIEFLPDENKALYYLNDSKIGKFDVNSKADTTKLKTLILGGGSDAQNAVVAYDNLKISKYIDVLPDLSYIRFKDENKNQLESANGFAPAGAKYIDIVFSGIQAVNNDNISLVLNGVKQNFSAEYKDGTYTMTLDKMLKGNESYALNINNTAATNYSLDFMTNDDGNKTALEGINALAKDLACTPSAMEKFIEDNKKELKFIFELYERINKTTAAKQLITHLKFKPFDTDDADSAISVFKSLSVAEALNQNKLLTLSEYAENLGLTESVVKIFKDFGNTETADVLNKLSGKNISGIDGLSAMSNEAVILSAIKYADGYSRAKSIITDNNNLIKAGLTNANDNTFKAVANVNFNNFEELKKKISENKRVSSDNSSGGTGGGGRSSNINSGMSANSVPNVETPANDDNTLNLTEFYDVPNDAWYKSELTELVQRGIINGKGNGIFAPNENITRAEAAKMIVSAMKITSEINPNTKIIFDDVKSGDWFFKWVMTAAENGIVNGTGDGMFLPNDFVLRSDMAVIIYNAYRHIKGVEPTSRTEYVFADKNEIPEYASDAVDYLVQKHIINGYSDGTFRPNDSLKRCEGAKLIYGFIELIEQEEKANE